MVISNQFISRNSSRPGVAPALATKQQQTVSKMSTSPPQSSSPSRSNRKRVTKDEKIAQLKSELKLSKEENARLKREVEQLKQGGEAGGSKTGTSSNNAKKDQSQYSREEEQQKFREAMRAFKKVTVKQELCIKTLRGKAKERRKDIKERDNQIKKLEQKMRSLETANKSIKGDQDLHSKFKSLQIEKDRLEEILDEKESQLESLQKQRKNLLDPLSKGSKHDKPSDGDSVESGSSAFQSVATESDFNVAKLKAELARKSEKILSLQMNLENVKDELFAAKQQKRQSAATGDNSDLFAETEDPFSISNAFGKQMKSQSQMADDWTDVDDTDNESEFGEMQFGESFFPSEEDKLGNDPFFKGQDSKGQIGRAHV